MPFYSSNTNTTFSVINSTTTPLGANETWVGDFEDMAQFATMFTLWRTDAPGTLYYAFSMDGITIDRSFPVPTLDLTDGNYLSTGPRGRYFRVSYVNGPAPQTILRLQTTYSAIVTETAHAAIGAGLGTRTTSEATRSLVFGQTTFNTYQPLKVAADGTLIINTGAALSPNLTTNKLITETTDEDQVIVSYMPTETFQLGGWSVYVWDTLTSAQVVYGEVSLESPAGTKLYTSQLTSLAGGKNQVNFPTPLIFPSGQTVRLVCTPSGPINSQTWQGNLVGYQ